ncbi:glycosyltransferase family 2 protein [Novosphingobium sp. 9U]|uniref:glycosyltransferase family 2 protein n=1 Tax=Novosphingobium sp. 9U TaxID=2653158 RepID=UPI001F286B90|nr:glycosyltransferase family 2 protein [Novosphingobium sp. 9U]
MPCLNEKQSLPHCVANAREALALIEARYGLGGEVVVADNGSTDGSQALAIQLGARVVDVCAKGYGAALIGGFEQAYGRFLVMGDADGSYDFTDAVAMVGRLLDGADLCMGSRFEGGIGAGAMPWKNRYIGNPALTGILNLFFRTGVDDAHCGLRAIRREAYGELALQSCGMEFASEMVIKASLRCLRIDQVPATLSPDLRDRAPHLRPWRDGWRHLRYLFMLSPTWAFGVPAAAALLFGAVLLLAASIQYLHPGVFPAIGPYWTLLGSASVDVGHQALLFGMSGNLYGVRAGYRRGSWMVARRISLEAMLVAGLALITAGCVILALVAYGWVNRDFQAARSILPPVLGTLACILGFQTMLGGLLMAIIGGNEAQFGAAARISPAGHRTSEGRRLA